MNPRIANRNHDRLIDQALRRIASATPPEGMGDRITARLARERANLQHHQAGRSLFFGIPRLAFGMAAAAVACFGIVAGSVHHSHISQPRLPGFTPSVSTDDGLGSAGTARPADRPVTASPTGRPRSVRRSTEGRAVISTPSQKPAGVAVPKTPASEP